MVDAAWLDKMVEIQIQMKPYGRVKNVRFPSKTDGHYKENNRKIKNWWEAQDNTIARTTIKQTIKKEIENETTILSH
jgi:hypothetical protein